MATVDTLDAINSALTSMGLDGAPIRWRSIDGVIVVVVMEEEATDKG